MNERLILKKAELERVKDSSLFYPCSGNDLRIPIKLFSPYVTDFWFVDKGYFVPGHQDTKSYRFDKPADKQRPVLSADKDYMLIDTTIRGPVSWRQDNPDIEPCILTEIYTHIPSNREVRIHRRRGYGFSALEKEIRSMGVFFYRGDSEGEGGSGNFWLQSDHIKDVCDKLIDGGLIVTDGSQQTGKTYHSFAQYKREKKNAISEEFIQGVEPFTDKDGRSFTCIGYAGERYGPTLIWQIRHEAGSIKVLK